MARKLNNHTELCRAIIDYSRLCPDMFLWLNNSGAAKVGARFIRFGFPGSSDIIGVYRGRFIAVEVKTGTGRQTPLQREFQCLIENAGGTYLVCRNIDDFISFISQHD